jgi:Tfp pilus assembly protein PilX/CII-binding regulator of phage lambda lysogenization HflD
MRGRLRRALRELRRSERGFALPMALVVTVVAMGFAAVPVVASINAQSGDSHNQGSNEALAAAEAGAEVALLKQSRMLSQVTDGTHPACVAEALTIATGGESGWCPKVPGAGEARPKVGAAAYSYQVRPCYAANGGCDDLASADTENCTAAENQLLVEIVSTGYATVAGKSITKRIAVTGCANTTTPPSVPGEIAEIEREETTLERKIEEKEEEVTVVTRAVTEKEEKIEVVEGVQKTETAATEEKWTKELTALEKKKTEDVTQLKTLEAELTELQITVEHVKTEASGTEYTETPGETYTEVVKTAPPNVWGPGQIVGIEGLTMGNNAQIYNGGAASNKAVSMVGSANVCGTVHYGTTFTTDNSTSSKAPSGCAAGRTATQATSTYPAVTLPSNIATENSDSRICTETACHKGLDPVPSSVWERGNISYNASNKQLTVNYSSLTLEGTAPYYLCQLVLAGGSSLYAGSGKSITIYFAPPSTCPGLNGAAQLQIANGTYVYADASSGPKLLFVGTSSSPASSKIEFAGGANSEQFVVYAPYSKIIANNGIEMTGAIIGNTLELQGGASINKYGVFSPPPAETFLPSTETVVEKQKPGTKVAHESKYLEKLEAQLVTLKTKVETKKSEIKTIETEIMNLETAEKHEVGTIAELRQTEIRHLVEERTRLESEVITLTSVVTTSEEEIEVLEGVKATKEAETGGTAEAIQKQSFRECTGDPPVDGLAPDEGC